MKKEMYVAKMDRHTYELLKKAHYSEMRKIRRFEIYSKIAMVIGSIGSVSSMFLVVMNLFINYYEWEKNAIATIGLVCALIYVFGFKLYHYSRGEEPFEDD